MIVNHFAALGVHRGSTEDEIKLSWRVLAASNHPDKGGDAERFASLSTAYRTLTESGERAMYIAKLEFSGRRCINCDGLGYVRKQRGWREFYRYGCLECGGCGVVDREVKT